MLRKLRDLVFYLLFVSISTLLLLEICYRFYVVDFYKGSLTGLNSPQDLLAEQDKSTILILGDSFTADTSSYVKYLREAIPNHRIINSAVAGTSIRQHAVMAKSRIKRFEPDVLIYQIYVGNDLLEYRHPLSGGDISTLRKAYWWLADHLLVVGYINAKLPQLKAMLVADPNPGLGTKLTGDFAPEKYNRRVKMQFQAEPQMLEHTILLEAERGADFQAYVKEVSTVLALAPANCKVVVMVMPHCVQLGEPYLQRMQSLGAVFENQVAIAGVDFPFYTALKNTLSANDRYFFNALEYLGDENSVDQFYYENDPHLNPAGQLQLGKALVGFFQDTIEK